MSSVVLYGWSLLGGLEKREKKVQHRKQIHMAGIGRWSTALPSEKPNISSTSLHYN
ncbi:hypothetical protein GDO86_016170 [Hymenochirus boettgeri]|uniref:Uncharacterized protein n=1 Tax=Hymenochirus boettgeri TaxID=247094 RepID=A0A8T2JZB6_9PIPI|nr:hypothetical protein GDO86_016170 [Hymenochirus boettgeri]